MKSLDLPFLLFDSRGLLANGLLWVGEAFKDPQSYPVFLFDKENNMISNPVNVVNGRVDVCTQADKVSMLLLDSHGRQVWYLAAKNTVVLPSYANGGSPEFPYRPNFDNPDEALPIEPSSFYIDEQGKYVVWAGWLLLGEDETSGLNTELPSSEYVFNYLVNSENPKKYVSAESCRALLDNIIAGKTSVAIPPLGTTNVCACEPLEKPITYEVELEDDIIETRVKNPEMLGYLYNDTWFGEYGYQLEMEGEYRHYQDGDRLVSVRKNGEGKVEVSVDFTYRRLGIGVGVISPQKNFMSAIAVAGQEYYHLNYSQRIGSRGNGFKIFDFSNQVGGKYIGDYVPDADRESRKSELFSYGRISDQNLGLREGLSQVFLLSNLFERDGTFRFMVGESPRALGSPKPYSGVYSLNDDESKQVRVILTFCTCSFLLKKDSPYYNLPDAVWGKDFI